LFDVFDHRFYRFNQFRNIILANVEQLLGVHLEITTNKGHGLANGWVAQRARESGARLLLNTDCHVSAEMLDAKQRRAIAFGAGLTEEEVDRIWQNGRRIVAQIFG
jgi:histidinol phosphatase-like PHP family hydrolase